MKKQVIFLSVAGIIVLTGILSLTSQNVKTESIMIRSLQVGTSKSTSCIRIYKGNNVIEKIPLEKWDYTSDENNYDKIFTVVTNYEKLGYKLTSHSESSLSGVAHVNTFVLTKN